MAPRIGFVHTAAFLVEDFRRRLAERVPDADAFHTLDESLLQDLLRGAPVPEVHRRVAGQVLAAVDAGAELVVMTCSSTSPGVDAARAMTSRPILKIDDPMAEQAARIGGRVALVCSASSTVRPSAGLIGAHAERLGRRVEVRPRLVEGAYDALFAGDRDRHDELVLGAARDAAAGADVLVLAQASLAPLQERIARAVSVPVLASPELLMAELAARCA